MVLGSDGYTMSMWIIDDDGILVDSSDDGLTSWRTPLVDSWLAESDGFIRITPTFGVDYDPQDPSLVLLAHLLYAMEFTDARKVKIIDSEVDPYEVIKRATEDNEISLKFGE